MGEYIRMNFIEKLKNKGISNPVVIETEPLGTYPDIYNQRKEKESLSGLEPDFLDREGLKAYIAPWKYIVGMAIPYGLLPVNRMPQPNEISSISIMAWEWDYHQIIKELIEETVGIEYIYKIHVDQGPLPERYIAIEMGIAKAGRSQMLIHSEYGTAFHLTFILTNFEKILSKKDGEKEFEVPDFALLPTIDLFKNKAFELSPVCINCRSCQNHCPGNALTGEAEFDANKCISALTQKKGLLSEKEMEIIGGQLYGCDICQLCCPENSPLAKGQKMVLPDRVNFNRVDPLTIIKASQKTFARDFGKMGFSWRGLGVNKRNALINIGNYGNLNHLEVLEMARKEFENNGNEILVKTSEWAIHQIKEHHHRKGSEYERFKSTIGN